MPQIDSRNWTGPSDTTPTGYGRTRLGSLVRIRPVQDAARRVTPLPRELRRIILLATLLVFGSPVLLWLAWAAMVAVTHDAIISDNSHWLMLWGGSSVGLGLWQIMSRSTRFIAARLALVSAALLATVVAAGSYIIVGARAHAYAAANAAERTFEISESRGYGKQRYSVTLHQRIDGTLLEGGYRKPLPYASSCALAQQLVGPHGFSWVRVLERSRSPKPGGLYWAIRRQECFGETALSSLPA